MQIRLAADLQGDSIVDGEGLRTVIWTQGCPHHCLGCHNPETFSFQGGTLVDVSEVCELLDTIPNQDGITFSGGDPMMQPKACSIIAKYAHQKGLNVWCYTGFTFEELLLKTKIEPAILDFLKQIDVLVDGRFVLAEKSLNLKFKGSRNQRIIDVKESLLKKEAIIITKYADEIDHHQLYSKDKYMYI